MAWEHKVPEIRKYVLALVVGAITVALYIASQEAQEIAPDANSIQKQAVLTNRATTLCGTALWLQAWTIPFMAWADWHQAHSWHETVLTLMDVSSPLQMALQLRTVRRNMLVVLVDANRNGKGFRCDMGSPSQLRFALSQQEFYGEITSMLKSEIYAKAVFLLLSL